MARRYDRKDAYHQRAKREGYRSRAAYKLLEIQRRARVLRRGQRVIDVGCWPGGWLQVAAEQVGPKGRVVGLDLAEIEPVFEDYALSNGVANRLSFAAGDFWQDDLPKADVILMGHILHDWNLEEKKTLIGKAYDAVPEGGVPSSFNGWQPMSASGRSKISQPSPASTCLEKPSLSRRNARSASGSEV